MVQDSAQKQAGVHGLVLRGAIAFTLISIILTVVDTRLKLLIADILPWSHSGLAQYAPNSQLGVCRQQPKLSPKNKKVEQFVKDKVESHEYREEIISKLSGIIQIPSESYDDLGVIGEDERWDVFYKIEDYIKVMYPQVFNTVKLDHANTHGLILTWQGSVPEAKPILMLAHQDVVPVLTETVDDWTHPPYEGFYDGEIIWGRGATDDKGYLISIIESVDLLIKSGFQPKRSVILAFGCDEEISGENCGRPISQFLHNKYGDDGVYLIMDEGSVGLQREFDQSFAMVSVAEKGYLDVGINVTSTGGHASNPPDHNTIGIMAEIIQTIENNPFPGRVTTQNPMFGFLECAAVHAPESSYPSDVRKELSKVAQGDPNAELQLARLLDDLRYYFRTSQSVGKINGGVKINAIPEAVSAMINLRLSVETSVAQVEKHYEEMIRPIAEKHGMTFEGFYSNRDSTDIHKVTLVGIDALEPAPVSPVNSESFRILSGTIKNTLKPMENDEELIVTPYLMPANTDTKFFWNVTKNIYRFTPIHLVQNLNRAHTTDEFIRADEFVREPLFFATLILNADDVV
ncbi:carboxypeptidase S [Trichomonascus vanleenenianus]|uniref:M20 family metallopeptidase n=1 Tax=Trichomonascus vanleenenianus TaxID=2268995 RepID=UPI003ECA9C3E